MVVVIESSDVDQTWRIDSPSDNALFINNSGASQSLGRRVTDLRSSGENVIVKPPREVGGGGGSSGGSDPSPQPDPEPDRSQLTTRLESLSSPTAEQVVVYWSVTNEVTSGTGQQKSGTVAVDLDGRTQERQSVSVSPGGSQSGSVRLADVTPGTREVCVRLQ